MAGRTGSTALFLVALVALDAAVIAAVGERRERATGAGGTDEARSPRGDGAGGEHAESGGDGESLPTDDGYALCLTEYDGRQVAPTFAAITYLDKDIDRDVTPEEIRTWFGELDPLAVDVYKLEHKNGNRRVAFEVHASKWPRWREVAAGATGTDVCGRVRAALLAAGVGRPDPQGDGPRVASRHDFELIYARRPQLHTSIEWVGPLDVALQPDTYRDLQIWLDFGFGAVDLPDDDFDDDFGTLPTGGLDELE